MCLISSLNGRRVPRLKIVTYQFMSVCDMYVGDMVITELIMEINS
jgi:hypothetical protein